MKVTVDEKNYRIKLDNEAIRAIRFVKGYNPDLRVKIKLATRRSSFWDWIDENRFGLLGVNVGFMKPNDTTSENWDKYEKMIYDVVDQVIGR